MLTDLSTVVDADALIADAVASSAKTKNTIVAQSNFTLPLRSSSGALAHTQPVYQTAPLFDYSHFPTARYIYSGASTADVPSTVKCPPATRQVTAGSGSDRLGWAVSGPQNVRAGPDQTPPSFAPFTQRLSYACQRRRFNPEIYVTQEGALFKCNIYIAGQLIEGTKLCTTEQAAKAHTAQRAFGFVCQWPLTPPFPTIRDVAATTAEAGSGPKQTVRSRQQLLSAKIKKEIEGKKKIERGRRTNGETNAGTKDPGNVGRIYPVMSPGSGSCVDMSDPVQARAYVEGFQMGQRAAMRGRAGVSDESDLSAADKNTSRRASSPSNMLPLSRSRSPKRQSRIDRNYRDRSRSKELRVRGRRGRGRGRETSSVPSNDCYRPEGPSRSGRSEMESAQGWGRSKADALEYGEDYGRLKEDDYYG